MHQAFVAGLRAVQAHLQGHPSISNSEMVEATHFHEDTAFRHLKFFVRLRLLKAIGKGRARVYVWAEERFKTMSFEQILKIAEEREKGSRRSDSDEEEFRKESRKKLRKNTPKPKTPPPPAKEMPPAWEQNSPVWSLNVPAGDRAAVWYRTESDNLHVTLREEEAVYVTLDPALRLKVAVSDHSRLVGFTSKPFSRLFRRRGFGPVLFADKKVKLEKLLSFIGLAVSADMAENGELNSPKAAKRLAALTEHLRAILWKLGNRSLYVADEGYWDELAK